MHWYDLVESRTALLSFAQINLSWGWQTCDDGFTCTCINNQELCFIILLVDFMLCYKNLQFKFCFRHGLKNIAIKQFSFTRCLLFTLFFKYHCLITLLFFNIKPLRTDLSICFNLIITNSYHPSHTRLFNFNQVGRVFQL